MKKKLFSLVISALIPVSLLAQTAEKNQRDDQLFRSISQHTEEYGNMALEIWDYAELGYQELKSSKLLQDKLIEEGFSLEVGVAEIPTAFVATYGSGDPVIAILAEFDALPGLSQGAVSERKVLVDRGAVHGCGHHLFGVGSMAAGIAVKDWLTASGKTGTIRVFGTPAEEGGGGKVYMVKAGLFDDVDVVLHWHPSNANSADAASSLANKSAKFRFHGQPSHAARYPHRGRSGLDGVEAMNHMVNMMREHIQDESRIHYVITRGGEAPNVVPGFAEVFYYCRHPYPSVVKKNFEWIVQAAQGAAMGTQTTMDYEIIHGLLNVLPNESLGRVLHRNLLKVGGVYYDAEELAFANKLVESFGEAPFSIESAKAVKPFQVIEKGEGGSTDVGDVSWVVPTASIRTATWVPGTPSHSWQAVACGATSIGTKGMLVAAKTLAITAADLIENPQSILSAWTELRERRGNEFKYESLIGDRTPPLDYRN
ncbi:MAG: amidohydrolase [Saprospiraceae bacterium]|nr:amidohydrolase [Saprospiraceae bacterium]